MNNSESKLLIQSLADETLARYKEINFFYKIGEKISSTQTIQEIGSFILKELKKVINFNTGIFSLFDCKTESFQIIASIGKITDNKILADKLNIANNRVRKHETGEIQNNLNIPGLQGYSIMTVPLKTRLKYIGAINICALPEKRSFFIASDLGILTAISSFVSNYIELLRLYSSEKELVGALKEKNFRLSKAKDFLAEENSSLKQNLKEKYSSIRILGISPAIKSLVAEIDKIANLPLNVLITGETGTGKEIAAKSIHYSSLRCDKPFIAINCSAIPESIFESEVFGIEKGIATGVNSRKGKLILAEGGTLFLDEIGDMPLSQQAKILRVIEEKEVVPVGASLPLKFDVRIIAATNKNLYEEVAKGNFREDLFYRLKVLNINIPPLKSRKEDISILANYFARLSSLKFGKGKIKISGKTINILQNYSWPGNVRELENEIERAVALSSGNILEICNLSDNISCYLKKELFYGETFDISEHEKELIKKVLAAVNGNKSTAAKKLGISREGLRKKMKKLGLIN